MKTIESTTEKSNSLIYKFKKEYTEHGEKLHTTVTIRLNDECKNGHQDFSATTDTRVFSRNRWQEHSGGCDHDRILRIAPELKQFVDLHLCDYNGAPMYAEANGFYHLQEARKDPSKMEMAREYVRATTEEWAILASAEDQTIFKFHLENLGIVKRWKVEADAAIKKLEELTCKLFLNDSKRSHYTPLTKDEKSTIEYKINTGYYHPDRIKEREDAKEKARRDKIAADLLNDMETAIHKEQTEYAVKMAVHNAGLSLDNFIFYNHNAEGVFNWSDSSYRENVTREQFDAFITSSYAQVLTDKDEVVPVTWKFKEPK